MRAHRRGPRAGRQSMLTQGRRWSGCLPTKGNVSPLIPPRSQPAGFSRANACMRLSVPPPGGPASGGQGEWDLTTGAETGSLGKCDSVGSMEESRPPLGQTAANDFFQEGCFRNATTRSKRKKNTVQWLGERPTKYFGKVRKAPATTGTWPCGGRTSGPRILPSTGSCPWWSGRRHATRPLNGGLHMQR